MRTKKVKRNTYELADELLDVLNKVPVGTSGALFKDDRALTSGWRAASYVQSRNFRLQNITMQTSS